jgi:solute:Na+ symporter, SSS family
MQVTLSAVDLAVFLSYLIAVGVIAALASRSRKQTRRDYFLGGDKMPWWMIGGSIVAANISSHHFVGVMGVAYSRGFVAVVGEWSAILIGFNALLWVFLPFYLRNGFYTMPEFLQRRFGGATRSLFAALILLIYVFVEIGAVLYFGALALNALLGIPLQWCIPLIALVTGVYTITGGLKAVVWTEMLQLAVLIGGGVTLSIITLNAGGGWSAFVATSPEWHIFLPANDPDYPWTMFLGGSLCTGIFYCAANQFIVQRVLAAKNEWHARMGVICAQYLKFLLPFLIIVPGMVGPKLFPNLPKPDMIFPTLVSQLLPAGLVGLVLAGLVAAVMSHISGALNSATTILTVDFYQVLRRNTTEDQAVRFGRRSGVVLAALGVVAAETLTSHSDRPVFLYLLSSYGVVTPGMATMFLIGIFWKRATQAGAISAGVATIVLSALIKWWFPTMPFLNRTGIVFWACIVIAIIVSLMTEPPKPEAIEKMIWNREALRLPAEERARNGGWRSPFLWWSIITVTVVALYIRYA